ncbi:MAG: hypothetical protein R2856_21795 [Caldilineaceae bacterium]
MNAQAELISRPEILAEDDDWRFVHLPTHPDHFYDVCRYEFDREISAETSGSPHVMSLVEGTSVILETEQGMRRRFNYAETFVVPAAASAYRLINEGEGRAYVVCAFLKPEDERSMSVNVVALDVGGTSVKSALVTDGAVRGDIAQTRIDSQAGADVILGTLAAIVQAHLSATTSLDGVAMGFPGPFEYERERVADSWCGEVRVDLWLQCGRCAAAAPGHA